MSDARGPTLRTPRLVLRRWRAEDLAPFAELNADPDVMAHMQKTMSPEESDAFVARVEEQFDDCGFGLWAVEAPNHSPFIGFVGLHRVPFDTPRMLNRFMRSGSRGVGAFRHRSDVPATKGSALAGSATGAVTRPPAHCVVPQHN